MRYGLEFPDRRREILRMRLREHVSARGCSWDEYLKLLEGPRGPEELQRVIDSITVHQTEFFRHRQLFEALRFRILPELSTDAERRGKAIQIWSAGCSTGEEPYSLAMIGLEKCTRGVEIVATDIAPGVLDEARRGLYPHAAVEDVPVELRTRFLLDRASLVEVGPELRKAVRFTLHNLVSDRAPMLSADLVMCCNVTIYFSEGAFLRAVETLCGALRPGGYLVLGHSESLWRVSHPLELVDLGGAFAYRYPSGLARARIEQAPPRPAPQPVERPHERPTLRPAARPAPRPAPPRPAPPPSPVQVAEIVAAAQGYLERDALAALEEILSDGLARAPSASELHLLMGILRQRQQRDDEAVVSFGRAIYCDATCSLAWFYRAAIHAQRDQFERAATDYATAARCFARDVPQRWDHFLESMGHQALIRYCEERAESLKRAAVK